jgi:AraC-like DNA-binding protein
MEIKQYEIHSDTFNEFPIILKRSILRRSNNSLSPANFNWHESIEVIYVDEGEGIIVCDFEENHVKCGDIFIINSDVLHSIRTDSYFSYYYLIIDSNFCKTNGLNISSIRFNKRISDSRAISMFAAILRTYTNPENYVYHAKLRAKVLDFMVFLSESHGKLSDAREHGYDKNFDSIRRAIIYIREHLSERITIDSLAEMVGISKFHFIREFKRITHYTPILYITVVRIETARRLIAETDVNISEISDKCGFDNLSYFSKTFKKYTGISPTKLRQDKK